MASILLVGLLVASVLWLAWFLWRVFEGRWWLRARLRFAVRCWLRGWFCEQYGVGWPLLWFGLGNIISPWVPDDGGADIDGIMAAVEDSGLMGGAASSDVRRALADVEWYSVGR